MKQAILGFIVGALVTAGVAVAGVDTHHLAHERAETFVCEHPTEESNLARTGLESARLPEGRASLHLRTYK